MYEVYKVCKMLKVYKVCKVYKVYKVYDVFKLYKVCEVIKCCSPTPTPKTSYPTLVGLISDALVLQCLKRFNKIRLPENSQR